MTVVYKTIRWITVAGVILLLLFRMEGLGKGIGSSRDTLEVSHALLLSDPKGLDETACYLSALRVKNPRDIQATVQWAHVQMSRGELSTLIPLLESGVLARDERSRLVLIRMGDQFLGELDVVHFGMAWQQAGVWGDLPQHQWLVLLETGRRAIREEEWNAALDLFRFMKTLRPYDAGIDRYLAGVLRDGYGDSSSAIVELEEAAVLDPGNVWSLIALGNLYLQVGRLDAAQHAFERALQLDPEHERAVVGIARAFQERGDLDEAAHTMESYLEAHPDNELVVLRLAGVYTAQARGAEAISLLETFLERNPDNVSALVTLGGHYKRMGRLDEAVVLVEHALQQGGGAPHYLAWGHDILADIATSRGDAETAAWHAEQAEVIREGNEAQ